MEFSESPTSLPASRSKMDDYRPHLNDVPMSGFINPTQKVPPGLGTWPSTWFIHLVVMLVSPLLPNLVERSFVPRVEFQESPTSLPTSQSEMDDYRPHHNDVPMLWFIYPTPKSPSKTGHMAWPSIWFIHPVVMLVSPLLSNLVERSFVPKTIP